MDLKDDIEVLTKKLSDIADLGSKVALALLALGLAYVVLYPAIGPALSNL